MTVIVMMMRRRHRRLRLRLQRAHKPAALGPDQPGAEGRDQAIADDLDRLLRASTSSWRWRRAARRTPQRWPPPPAPATAPRRTTARCRAARFPRWRRDRTRSPPCHDRGRRRGRCRRQRKCQAASRPRCHPTSRRGSSPTSRDRIRIAWRGSIR